MLPFPTSGDLPDPEMELISRALAGSFFTRATWEAPYTYIYVCVYTGKALAPHSSVLAWRIPGMEEPDGLPSMGSHRVGHD